MKKPKSKPRLLTVTKELFKNRARSLTLEVIAGKTGISYAWLASFHQTENPSVNTVERLYVFLSEKNLDI